MARQEEDYNMILKIDNLGNRSEILGKYLDHLRCKLFEAIELKDHFEIDRIDQKISTLKNNQK